MNKLTATIILTSVLTGPAYAASPSEPAAGTVAGLPPHYHPGHGGCRPGVGYSFVAEAPGHPSTYPKLVLRVFNGEIIGMVFESDAAAGWKPWYDQPDGKSVSHGGGPAHYSQVIYVKPPPSAADCGRSEGPGKPRRGQPPG